MTRVRIAAVALATVTMTFVANAQENYSYLPEMANQGQASANVDAVTTGAVAKKPDKPARKEAAKKTRAAKTAKAKATKTSGRQRARIDLTPKGDKKEIAKKAAGGTKTVALKTGSSGRYHQIIEKYASTYGVPVSLAHAVITIESNYRVDARGRAGEVGLMQIKPATARGLGYTGSIKALYNPETNIRYGMKYLGQARKLGGGTTCGTILKYNAGHGAKRMNPISQAYCAKVKRHIGG